MNAAKAHRLQEIENISPHLKGLDEIAAHMRMDTRSVEKLMKDGGLKLKKVLGQYRATKPQLDRFIEVVE